MPACDSKYLKLPKLPNDKMFTSVLYFCNGYVAMVYNKRTEENEHSPSTQDSLTSRFLTLMREETEECVGWRRYVFKIERAVS